MAGHQDCGDCHPEQKNKTHRGRTEEYLQETCRNAITIDGEVYECEKELGHASLHRDTSFDILADAFKIVEW